MQSKTQLKSHFLTPFLHLTTFSCPKYEYHVIHHTPWNDFLKCNKWGAKIAYKAVLRADSRPICYYIW
jgi:hypothetical protein